MWRVARVSAVSASSVAALIDFAFLLRLSHMSCADGPQLVICHAIGVLPSLRTRSTKALDFIVTRVP